MSGALLPLPEENESLNGRDLGTAIPWTGYYLSLLFYPVISKSRRSIETMPESGAELFSRKPPGADMAP